VGTGIQGVERGAAAGKLVEEAGVKRVELAGIEIAAADAGLMGDDDRGEPGPAETPDGLEGLRRCGPGGNRTGTRCPR
jgi:hypothetical protein